MPRSRFGLAIAAVVLLQAAPSAQAQTPYPKRPVRIVLPFGAGGIADITSRLVAEKLGERLGQRFVIENQPGAGGVTAARSVLSAPADGHTLALLTNGTAISVSLFKSLPFDPLADFVPVSSFAYFDFVFVANAESRYRSMQEVIAAARKNPNNLNIGTINVGSSQNLSAELLRSTAEIQVTIVPYRSTPEVLVGLLRNDVDVVIDSYAALRSALLERTVRAIGYSGPVRSPVLPRGADGAGGRCAGLRSHLMEWTVRAGQDSAGDRAKPQPRAAGCVGLGRDQAAVPRARHRSESKHAGRAARAVARRHRKMVRRDRAGRNSAAVAASHQ